MYNLLDSISNYQFQSDKLSKEEIPLKGLWNINLIKNKVSNKEGNMKRTLRYLLYFNQEVDLKGTFF